ncbi:7 transmembrane receptor [Oesophagostomum dentatum]|uniref:7 transmembrane receptor n=1 Tax=Oesophagostomum dentatum TaxID=61180 RepID=A0A0B1SZ83_OESDE|nr:7 transmembrane receptor [Oesophagostomum dentatum]
MSNESEELTCHRYIDDHPDLTNEPIVMVVFAILYIHIFVLGIVGNVAVLYLTLKNRHLQSVQNIFILNLAASDVLMCLTSLPITPITNVYKTWFFASPVCKLIPLVQGASVFVSTFSLSAIALDRYNLVVRPHRHPLRSRGASVVALLLWIISALVCMPYGWYMDVVRIHGLCGEFCTERWPLPEVRKGYALMVLVMQFILPFATMAVCYYTIFARLRERTESKLKKLTERTQLLESTAGNSSPSAKNFCTERWPLPEVRKGYALMVLVMQFILPFATMAVCYYTIFARLRERTESKLKKLTERTQLLESTAGNSSPSAKNEGGPNPNPCTFEEQQRLSVLASQRRTTTILASMVLLFGFTWLPHNVYTMIIEYDEGIFHNGESDNTYIVSMIAHLISMTTNVANPILYAWLNPSFKEMLLTSIRGKVRAPTKFAAKDTVIRVAKSDTTQEKAF